MDLNGRPDPPTEAGEKETLVAFLDFQRATLRWKCEGLTPEQPGTASIDPSSLTLPGRIRPLPEVALGWFVAPSPTSRSSPPTPHPSTPRRTGPTSTPASTPRTSAATTRPSPGRAP